jgi:hypothetical protein
MPRRKKAGGFQPVQQLELARSRCSALARSLFGRASYQARRRVSMTWELPAKMPQK